MKQYVNNSVLLIPDIHAPYHHQDALKFLEGVADKYQPDRVFQMGDLTDSYAFTRFPKDIEMTDTYHSEYKKVRAFTKELLDLFPEGLMMSGNHDTRLWDRAKIAGIPRGLITPYEEVVGIAGTGWKVVDEYTFTSQADRKQWYLAHTKGGSALAVAKALSMNVAFGHVHTKFSIESYVNLHKRIYGVLCGCLIGDDKYAFAYNKQSMVRPNRGCVVILRGVPRLIPMDVGPKGRWNGLIA